MITSAAAAPVPSGGGSDKWLNMKRVRQLAELLGPVLADSLPLAQGIDQGVTAGATHVNAAAKDAGEAVNQAAQGVGDVGQGAVNIAGQAVDETVHNLETGGGIAGDVVNALTGTPQSDD